MNPRQKSCYGALQLVFVLQLSISFILFITVVLHTDDLPNSESLENEFLIAAVISDLTMVPSSLLMIFIILRNAHSQDRMGNFHVAKPSASFTVAFVSWILDIAVALLRGIATFDCKDSSGPAPWQLTLVYYLGYVAQQCFQSKYIYVLSTLFSFYRNAKYSKHPRIRT